MCPICIASMTSMAIGSACCFGIAGTFVAFWRACKRLLAQRLNCRLIMRSYES